ncbi:hypothetical protein HAX54_001476 [Datura stramonium]|uniref:Uncharacterized protein n=1 Tax=Datura stramonium TaxID=4076 RepID=A0ABS8T383_DATST|nr:hypothetical protein [Datura stramonium]
MSTMRNCEDVFGYIESKQDILGKSSIKANDVVFCEHYHVLAHFFPYLKRSAVNIKGVFNTSNETKYETEAPEGISIDFSFYRAALESTVAFMLVIPGEVSYSVVLQSKWAQSPVSTTLSISCSPMKMKEHFCNPPSLINAPGKWHKFTSSLTVVLNTFEAQPLSDEGIHITLGMMLQPLTINILQAVNLWVSRCGSISQFRKFLSKKVANSMAYPDHSLSQLKDPSFRRHVLVQCLILFDYLKIARVVYIQRELMKMCQNVASAGVLPGEAKEEIKTSEQRVKKLLEMTPPKGIDFLHSIEHILERERNWVWWKARDGCPHLRSNQ